MVGKTGNIGQAATGALSKSEERNFNEKQLKGESFSRIYYYNPHP